MACLIEGVTAEPAQLELGGLHDYAPVVCTPGKGIFSNNTASANCSR